jgi:hypothetical protein
MKNASRFGDRLASKLRLARDIAGSPAGTL